MKSTESFNQVIGQYLGSVAGKDPLFAVSYAKPNKSLKDCITYILNTVKASGCNAFADEEIFQMAVHYYDEDVLKIGAAVKCKVVVNHSSEPKAPEAVITPEAITPRVEIIRYKIGKQKKQAANMLNQPSLFD